MKSAPSLRPRSLLVKTSAALGAFFLVLSFALAALMSPFQTLAELLLIWKPEALAWFNRPVSAGAGAWFWNNVAVPVLLRPDWMLPTMIGLIFVGVAAQMTWGRK